MNKIEGIKVIQLKKICDERGMILKMQQATSEEFAGFGEIYFSTIYPGVIKGWHLHNKMTLNYTVIKGMIKLVLIDNRDNSLTKGAIEEIYLGEHNYCLVQIPPGIWSAFKGIGTETAIVADLTNIPYDSSEITRLDLYENDLINYDWK